jgi:hypothetical protein
MKVSGTGRAIIRRSAAVTIHDVERQLDQLSRDEKAPVFQRLALDLDSFA